MNAERARRQTFVAHRSKWPHPDDGSLDKNKMAAAGFYFVPEKGRPTSDRVVCFACEKALNGWAEGDDVMCRNSLARSLTCGRVEHRKFVPECPFVLDGSGNVPMDGDDSTPQASPATASTKRLSFFVQHLQKTAPPKLEEKPPALPNHVPQAEPHDQQTKEGSEEREVKCKEQASSSRDEIQSTPAAAPAPSGGGWGGWGVSLATGIKALQSATSTVLETAAGSSASHSNETDVPRLHRAVSLPPDPKRFEKRSSNGFAASHIEPEAGGVAALVEHRPTRSREERITRELATLLSTSVGQCMARCENTREAAEARIAGLSARVDAVASIAVLLDKTLKAQERASVPTTSETDPNETMARAGAAERALEELQKQHTDLQKQYAELQHRHEEVPAAEIKHHTSQDAEVVELRQSVEELGIELSKTKLENEKLRHAATGPSDGPKELRDEVSRLTRALSKAQARVAELEEEREGYEQEIEFFQNQIEGLERKAMENAQ